MRVAHRPRLVRTQKNRERKKRKCARQQERERPSRRVRRPPSGSSLLSRTSCPTRSKTSGGICLQMRPTWPSFRGASRGGKRTIVLLFPRLPYCLRRLVRSGYARLSHRRRALADIAGAMSTALGARGRTHRALERGGGSLQAVRVDRAGRLGHDGWVPDRDAALAGFTAEGREPGRSQGTTTEGFFYPQSSARRLRARTLAAPVTFFFPRSPCP